MAENLELRSKLREAAPIEPVVTESTRPSAGPESSYRFDPKDLIDSSMCSLTDESLSSCSNIRGGSQRSSVGSLGSMDVALGVTAAERPALSSRLTKDLQDLSHASPHWTISPIVPKKPKRAQITSCPFANAHELNRNKA
ncbi:MAG: hypothetical protein V2I33_19860 [Kangiellaceae bacterium]|nr:hypothetical protein [Kangiellaceae bacterium]